MTGFIDVRTATASKEDAQKIAHALVSQRLAASVQVSGPISSMYWWKGEMVSSEEWVVTAKTQQSCYQHVEQAIRHLHPYEEPGIIAFPIVDGSTTYFEWIINETMLQEPQNRLERAETSKEQLLCAFDEAHEKLVNAASHAAKWGVQFQNGVWGPREVLAHIAGWAAQATTQLLQVITGVPPITYASEVQHAGLDEAANTAFIALIGNQTFEEVLTITHQAHRRFVDMLRAQDDTIFVPGNYVYERMKRVIAHHLEHAQELEDVQG
jgi:periplasmic divalent cation tolerance protein